MKRFCLGLLCLLPVPVLADGRSGDARGRDCGGDAYTFAEVVPAQPGARRREPIMVLPDTLCADLAADSRTRIDSLNVFIDTGAPADEQTQKGSERGKPPYRRY